MRALALLILLALATPAVADNAPCAEPVHRQEGWVGRQYMVSLVIRLESPGRVIVCADLLDFPAGVQFNERNKLPAALNLPNPVWDPCVHVRNFGTHPGDAWSKVQVWDTAGSFACLSGTRETDVVLSEPRVQYYMLSWYWTP